MSEIQEARSGGFSANKAITQSTKQPPAVDETGMQENPTFAAGQLALDIQADEGLLQLVRIYQKG
jgi:hypothetical protein